MRVKALVSQKNWDKYWSKISLPLEVSKTKRSSDLNEILKVFDRFLPRNRRFSVLEIGGAPGQYLAYMTKNFPCSITSLDYSTIGCSQTKKNFQLLRLKGTVYQRNLFSDLSDLPLFDIVYSLGFVEHFFNVQKVIQRHLCLLKPGGLLLVGVPNFQGINHFLARILRPEVLKNHNLLAMDKNYWQNLENNLALEIIFKKYIGGFNPEIFARANNANGKKRQRLLNFLLAATNRTIDYCFKYLRLINCRHWSSYLILIYKKPE